MKQIKIIARTVFRVGFIIGLIVILGAVLLVRQPHTVYAVSPDSSQPLCYDAQTVAGSGTTYTTVSCPSGRNLQPGLCYVVTPGPTQQGAGVYTETDCSGLTTGGAGGGVNPSGGAVNGTGSADLDSYLNTIVNLLAGLVGLIIVLSIIIAGIQYMTARDNASQVSAAKDRILMAVLAFFVFVMGYALLQWLIPGGVFK